MPRHFRDPSRDSGAFAAARTSEPDAAPVQIRQLASLADYRACVDLQTEVWGEAFDGIVPAPILQVVSRVGGLAVGAFTGDTLIGFVFGLTGVKNREIVHWSHMLGVRAVAREMGIGRRLKEYQRAELARRGVAREFWTFDPLHACSAHLNINRLGVRVIDYAENMYGATGSPLHFGIPTDRLIVELATGGERTEPALGPTADFSHLPILTPMPRPGDVLADGQRPRAALIEIPLDIQNARPLPRDEMLVWRNATRTCFQWAFLHAYRVTSLYRDREASRVFYVIERTADT